MSVETLEQEALALPTSRRAELVEKLLASLSGEVDLSVEKANLDEVQKRRIAASAGEAIFIEGAEALRRARTATRK
jgi:hypothetical protein